MVLSVDYGRYSLDGNLQIKLKFQLSTHYTNLHIQTIMTDHISKKIQDLINDNIYTCEYIYDKYHNGTKSNCDTIMKKLMELRDSNDKCSNKKELFDTLKFALLLHTTGGQIRCYSKRRVESYRKNTTPPTQLFVNSRNDEIRNSICEQGKYTPNSYYKYDFVKAKFSYSDTTMDYLDHILITAN